MQAAWNFLRCALGTLHGITWMLRLTSRRSEQALFDIVFNSAMLRLTSRSSEQAFGGDCYWRHSDFILLVHAEATRSGCTLASWNYKKHSHTKCSLLLFHFWSINFEENFLREKKTMSYEAKHLAGNKKIPEGIKYLVYYMTEEITLLWLAESRPINR